MSLEAYTLTNIAATEFNCIVPTPGQLDCTRHPGLYSFYTKYERQPVVVPVF